MLNFGLAREIYGGTPWLVDAPTFHTIYNLLKDIRGGLQIASEKKKNSFMLAAVNQSDDSTAEIVSFDNSDRKTSAISITQLDGLIIKNSGNSTIGTKELAANMTKFDQQDGVIGHAIIADSGGGSSDGVPHLADAIKNAKKPVIGFIEKTGKASSACYYILSYCDYIISESSENLIGSIGAMMTLEGYPKDTTNTDDYRRLRFYATESVHKNDYYEQAINKGNTELITTELLDPLNRKFQNDIRKNRPKVKESQLTGKVYKAESVVGSLVDEIGSFQRVVQIIKNKSKYKSSGMDKKSLKQEHPEIYSKILQDGALSEKERIGAWMAYSHIDLETVKKGIDSGKDIDSKTREELIIKSASLTYLNNLEEDSAPELDTPESGKTKPKSEVETFYASIEEQLKIA